mmetsp:Transcript_7689/g.22511  ORF Transcript_7689/g.22511 Transcript_7689/m.22511 type:complete len:153 (+) Transcript_7689:616-1074(+)
MINSIANNEKDETIVCTILNGVGDEIPPLVWCVLENVGALVILIIIYQFFYGSNSVVNCELYQSNLREESIKETVRMTPPGNTRNGMFTTSSLRANRGVKNEILHLKQRYFFLVGRFIRSDQNFLVVFLSRPIRRRTVPPLTKRISNSIHTG